MTAVPGLPERDCPACTEDHAVRYAAAAGGQVVRPLAHAGGSAP